MFAEVAGLQPLLDLSMYSSICRGEGAGSGGFSARQRGCVHCIARTFYGSGVQTHIQNSLYGLLYDPFALSDVFDTGYRNMLR